MEIDAKGIYYRALNERIRETIRGGEKNIVLRNVNGQYYIGDGIVGDDIKITINGVPGNDLAAFMDGPFIEVMNNAQDNISNTMNSGKVIVHGNAGDVLGYGMRGGKLFVRGSVGYRVGIHMKGYMDQIPTIVIGETAGDFLGEYMAGGNLILLGISSDNGEGLTGDYLGTGIHGGAIFIRGEVDKSKCGKEVGITEPSEEEVDFLRETLEEYCKDFDLKLDDLLKRPFKKLYPQSARPYGKLYAY